MDLINPLFLIKTRSAPSTSSSTFSTIPTVVASTSNEATNTNYGVNVNSHTTSTVQIYCTENGATTDKSVVSVIVFRNWN